MLIRGQIISFFINELKKIKKSNGFNTNAGENVFEWRDSPLQKTELPGLIIRDALVRREIGTIGSFRWVLRIDVACFGRNAEEIRNVIADVIKVIGICEEQHFGGIVTYTDISSADTMIERHDIEIGSAIISCDVIYETGKWVI